MAVMVIGVRINTVIKSIIIRKKKKKISEMMI